jgi:glycolate oxidase iron-sulfur subunit
VTEPAVQSKTAKDWGKFMLYEGCTMPRRMVGSRYTTRFVLDKYGFDYITLDNAKCCGAPVMRSGGEDVSIECRVYNLDLALKAGVNQIVTGCPGCGSQLKSEEAEKMGIHVYHFIEVLYDLAKNNEIYLKDQMRPIPKLTITAHYPCHMHFQISHISRWKILPNAVVQEGVFGLPKKNSLTPSGRRKWNVSRKPRLIL